MRRRSNKSAKVPNVKLRPPAAAAPSKPSLPINPALSDSNPLAPSSSFWSLPASDDTQAPQGLDTCPRPFRGVVLCATGVVDKPTLFKQAMELGALCVPAFTDRVTHLVAVGHGGAKYQCALERKIPILQPSWINDSYQIWLRGDDVDLASSTKDHLLPIFSDVILCPSGISSITRRTQIHKHLTANGGAYTKNLERPIKVTHLLCSGDEETDKMRYAEKFNQRGEAHIELVWEEWFWDCLEFGGRFDESTYQVRRPRPERKTPLKIPEPEEPQSQTAPSSPSQSSAPAPAPIKPPPPPQGPNEETPDPDILQAQTKPLLPQLTLRLWSGLLSRRGYEVEGGSVVLSPSKRVGVGSPLKRPFEDDEAEAEGYQFDGEKKAKGKTKSVIDQFRRANSFQASRSSEGPAPFRRVVSSSAAGLFAAASGDGVSGSAFGVMNMPSGRDDAKRNSNTGDDPTTPKKAASASNISHSLRAGPSNPNPNPHPQHDSTPPPQIFTNLRFLALGEARTPAVREAIEGCGGEWVVSHAAGAGAGVDPEEVDFVVVRVVSGSKLYRTEPDLLLRSKYRTESWLEKCIFAERVCEPAEHVSFVPVDVEVPVRGAEKVVMSISGFDESEACGIRRLMKALGITPAPVFTRKTTHLLCPSGSGLKFDKANEWGVPVVGTEWLEAMAKGTGTGSAGGGGVPGVNGYLVGAGGVREVAGDVGGKSAKAKGKEKEKASDMDVIPEVEEGMMMNDITNDISEGSLPPAAKSIPSLDRQLTILIDEQRGSPGNASYNYINESTLRESYYDHHLHSSIVTPNLSPVIEYGTRGSSFGLSAPGSFAIPHNDTNSSLSLHDHHPSRKPTLQEIETDMRNTRIPSSKSPSPMKMAPSLGESPHRQAQVRRKGTMSRSTSRQSLSPLKVDKEATKALQESITSLLGKRTSSEEEVRRTGKRARPQRSNVSRVSSEAHISAVPASTPPPFGESSINPFDMGAEKTDEAKEESMRVMYEDPAAREEKNRLMNLLKVRDASTSGQSQIEKLTAKTAGTRTRRSQRIAGF